MLEDVRYNVNNNTSADDTRIKSSGVGSKSLSFRATNPNAVDTTPTADTYSPVTQELPPEMSMGEKYLKYGVPAGAGLYVLSELFDKANQGEYEKSLLGRLGRFGDYLSGTPLLKNKFMDWVKDKSSSAKTRGQAFIDRHETLSVMQKTPTKPTCPLVVGFLETQTEDDLKKGVEGLKKHFLESNPKTLNLAGATEAEINALKTKFGTGMFGRINNESKAVEEFLLQKLGTDLGNPNYLAQIERGEANLANKLAQLQNQYNNANLSADEKTALKQKINKIKDLQKNYRANKLSKLKYRAVGLNKDALNVISKEPAKYANDIERALETSTKYSSKISGYFNKVKSISAPATKLGKFLPKAAKLGMRGLTFGGGFFNCLLMLGFFLGDAVKNTLDAPKDQKVATGVHGLFDAMSWVVAMPLAVKGMHAVNGLKNLGKTEAQVKAYETAYKEFKEKTKACGFASKAEHEAAWQNVQRLKNAGTKPKGIKWVLSKLATFTSIGLGQKPRYKEATASFGFLGSNIKNWAKPDNLKKIAGNFKRIIPNMPKNWIGYPLRFALYMFAFQPIVDKLFTLPIKAMFGKPYEPEAEHEKLEKEQEAAQLEELRKRYLYPGPSIMPNPDAVNGLDNLDVNALADDNLVKQELIKKGLAVPTQNFKTIPSDNNGYMNSANGVQIDIRNSDKPFMPGVNVNENCQNGQFINNQKEKDPNKSDYDTVPRSFVPEINKDNPVPYSDPFTNPNYERNYDRMRESIEQSEKFIAETEKWIDNKFEA